MAQMMHLRMRPPKEVEKTGDSPGPCFHVGKTRDIGFRKISLVWSEGQDWILSLQNFQKEVHGSKEVLFVFFPRKIFGNSRSGDVDTNFSDSFFQMWGCNFIELLLMEEILYQLIGSLSHYLQGFIHPRWCRISSIDSMTQ